MSTSVVGGEVGSDEMVSLPVPKKHFGAIVQALARLMKAEAGTHAGQASPAGVPWPTEGEEPTVNVIDWTNTANCRQLRSHLKNAAALAMLDLTSEKPSERVYLDAVEERCGCTRGQAKA